MLAHLAADPVREHNLYEKQMNQLYCLCDIAKRARERGIVPVFHPNSGPNSIFRYESDYHIMFDMLYEGGIGYAPDAGHMANGGIDPLSVIKEHRDLVQHVHFKDMTADHTWATMGTGIIDFESIVRYLEETDYRGWIMTEDESPDAVADSDGVVLADGKYMAPIRKRQCRRRRRRYRKITEEPVQKQGEERNIEMKKAYSGDHGTWRRGKTHLKALLDNKDRYEVVGLCDIRPEVMDAVSEKFGLDVPKFTDVEKMLARQSRRFLYSLPTETFACP